jgi:glycosyltransferase involved in cell wall biosynthesis
VLAELQSIRGDEVEMRPEDVRFTLMGFLTPNDGYGYAAIKAANALSEAGARVTCVDMASGAREEWEVGEPTVVMCVPDWLGQIDAPKVANYTMFESTRLPAGRAEEINRHAQACVVPCQWNADVFRACGVEVPVHVVPLGVDEGDYWLMEREGNHKGCPNERPYTFLWNGTPDLRKGWDVAYQAFWEAFRGSTEARLVLHFRELPKGVRGCRDDNVEIVVGKQPQARFRRLMWEADCFVFPSRGEGWGLPPREAAATGLPVIATNWGGLAVDIGEWALPLRVRGTSPARFGWWGDDVDLGEWAEPDAAHLAELMRWCFEHREEAAAMGERAADWIATHGRWARTAEGLLQVMEAL